MRGNERIRIPEKIRIAGKVWRVRFVDLKPKRAVGFCHFTSRVIEIDSSLPRWEQELTFAHELLHALWPRGMCSDRLEEKLVFAMEERLYRLLASGQLTPEAT